MFTCQLWKQIEIKETTKESAAAATPATIQRRRRPKRRSTGVVQIDMEVVHTILPLLFSTTLVYLHNSYYYQRHSHRLLTHTPTYLLNINRLYWGFFSVNLLIVNSGGKKNQRFLLVTLFSGFPGCLLTFSVCRFYYALCVCVYVSHLPLYMVLCTTRIVCVRMRPCTGAKRRALTTVRNPPCFFFFFFVFSFLWILNVLIICFIIIFLSFFVSHHYLITCLWTLDFLFYSRPCH